MTEWAERLARRIEAIDSAAVDNRLRAESYRQLTEDLKQADGTATSPDGVVTVVAGAGGALKSITFSQSVHSVPPAALSTIVMQTIARAQADAARSQADAVRRGLGSTELLDRVLAEEERVFGDEPTRAPAFPATRPVQQPVQAVQPLQAGRGRHSRHAAPDNDDFEDGFDIYQRNRR
ncbi:DNA-binding protein YbaB [Kibdelosporangium banguiense]|uniref:DNA-binding protein YbaB n=1 Tax=Kibdelosporangium banguiense TaxID=1365924 RepID=A0ABS4TU94_9PSEU|nr:YbaB/EbfC family nucleoid-associated protein [Kibdelosporangium banguiense]MBP2327982.1 DNA-binding protein YbaB [Kibdelosporangium banguiense]